MDAFVSSLLPLHEGPVQSALVLMDEAQLDALHVVAVVLAVLLPDHQRLVLDVAVLEVGLAQGVILGLGRHLLLEALLLVLELLALGDLRLKQHPRGLELLVGVAELDSVEALLEEALGSDTFDIGNQGLLSGKELVLAGLLTPVLPGEELALGHLVARLLAGLLEGEEDALLEGGLGDNLAQYLVLLLHVLGADGGDPLDKRPSLRPQAPPPADRHHEVLLRLPVVVEVSPPAEVVAELELYLTAAEPVEHLDSTDLVGIDALPVQVELAPEEEELLAGLVGDVAVDDRVSLVVLVDDVEGLAIPDAEVEALSIDHVVAEDAVQLADPSFQVDHDFGGRGDLLETKLLLAADILVDDLEHELGDERLDMLLVLMLSVDPLNIHLANIGLVSIAQLIHPADQVVPLVREVLQLVVEGYLVLTVLDFVASVVLKLLGELPDAAPGGLMILL